MTRFWLIAVLLISLSGCAGWQDKGRPIVKTVTDIAGDLCDVIANEQIEVDPEALGGLTIEDYCGIEENVSNVLDIIFSAKEEATTKMGFKPPEE